MVDGVLLLVDASEGPLPQTRFVLGKALEAGPRAGRLPQQDRPAPTRARPRCSTRSTASSSTSAPTSSSSSSRSIYTNARAGTATPRARRRRAPTCGRCSRPSSARCPARPHDPDAPTQFQANNLDYDDYVGRLAIGRVVAGSSRPAASTCSVAPTARRRRASSRASTAGRGCKRVELERADRGRHRRGRRHRGHRDRRHHRRPRAARGAAAHPRRRADHRHALRREHEPVGGPQRQPGDVAPGARAARSRRAAGTSASASRRPTPRTRSASSAAASCSSRS